MSLNVARKYAVALFEKATDLKLEARVAQDFDQLNQLLQADSRLAVFLDNPKIELLEKKYLFSQCLDKLSVTEIFKALMYVLLNNHRFSTFSNVRKAYEDILHEKEDVVQGELTLTSLADTSVIDEIEASFEKRLNQKIAWFHKEDEKMIAGFQVRIGDMLYDASMGLQLKNLVRRLLNESK